MRKTDLVILHCSDTPNGKHFTVKDIDNWHRERGFQRKPEFYSKFNSDLEHIGYHYCIYVDGSIHTGRSEDEIGAHAEGYNSKSIGICMIGKDKFTLPQWNSLKILMYKYSDKRFKGHYQVDTKGKTCPNFNVPNYIAFKQVDPDDIYTA